MSDSRFARIASVLRSRPTLLELLLSMAIILPLTCVAGRFVTEILALVFVVLGVVGLLPRCAVVRTVLAWLLALWVISFVLPVDVAVRDGERLSVRWVDVFAGHEGIVLLREARANGLVENRDFVVYLCSQEPVRVRKALLVLVKARRRIVTPLVGSPLLGPSKSAAQ